MWKRFVNILRCPICQGELDLIPIEEYNVQLRSQDYAKGEVIAIESSKLDTYLDSGMLLCEKCKYWFPILYGLPILLPYETAIFREFIAKHKNIIHKYATEYVTPKEMPRPGEEFVLRSFSKEWLNYNYDGVLWGWSYEDREQTFLAEIGIAKEEVSGVSFLDVGCGLGVITYFAEKNYNADAVGIDLSLAVLKATNYFKKNPFMHFVQASLFELPFKKDFFDIVYSHGVLHHTYSTKEAIKAISASCKPGGSMYIWVYGRHGLTSSWDRKLGYFAESLMRPFLSRAPGFVTTAILTPFALSYIFLNSILRRKNPTLQVYDFKRALHAARDRFTPLFAHRHSYDEVERWFKEFGYENIQKIDWHGVPAVVHNLFRGAVSVRGQRKKQI